MKICDSLSNDIVKDWFHQPRSTKSPDINCTNDISMNRDYGLTYLFWGTQTELDNGTVYMFMV